MRRSIWHLSWENAQNATGGLGVACSELVHSLGAEHHLISANSFFEGRALVSNYSSYHQPALSKIPDWEAVLHKLITGQSLADGSVSAEVWHFNQSILRLERESLRAIHVHDWHGILAGVALQRIKCVPLVLHLHSSQQERVGRHVEDVLSSLEQWGMEQSDRVICVSRASANLLIPSYGILASKLSVLNNSSLFRWCDVRNTNLNVLFVGRMTAQKSPAFLVEVLRSLLENNANYTLSYVGDGEDLTTLRALTEFYGLEHAIHFVSRTTHASLAEIYQGADIVCMPSYAEPFGLVALEAVRMGKPVLLSERCGVGEILRSAPQLSIQQPKLWAQTVDAVLSNTSVYEGLVASLQKEAASYTWQDAAENVLAIYAKLLD